MVVSLNLHILFIENNDLLAYVNDYRILPTKHKN
jgi:hypothetical protein